MGQYTIKDVQNRAELLKGDVDNIYRALNDKLGSSPETLDQVPEYILSIPDLPTEEPLTITPTIDRQEISGGGEIKYDPITVEPVTSAIDSSIQPENIKEGVIILGVTGTHKGEKPEETFNIQPTTAEQTIAPTEGSVFSGGTVHAVTSAIDNNIQPENIKEGVSILGVAGTLSAGSGVFVVPNGMKFSQSTLTEFPSNLDTSNMTDMSKLFASCYNLQSIPQLDTSKATTMSGTFSYCRSITTIPLLDTSNVTDMNAIFSNCSRLTTIPQLNTSKVTDMSYMFFSSNIADVPLLDTSNVTNMSNMFNDCSRLTTIPQLNTSKVNNISYIFSNCPNLKNIPQLDTSNVTNMSGMFGSCSKITTIPQLDTSKVTNMYQMFLGCSSLTTVEKIDFSGLTSNLTKLFGSSTSMPKLTRFIVNGKINVSISDNNSIKALTAIDYDSVKSILTAASNTDNTNEKTLAFNRTIADQNGELAALVTQCAAKGWTITGLTLQ